MSPQNYKLSPPLFIEVPITSQESNICVLGESIFASLFLVFHFISHLYLVFHFMIVTYILISTLCRGNVSLSTSDRLESRSEMPAGNCTVWNTVSSLTVRCPQTRPLEVVTTPSTPSSVRPEPASTYPEPSLSIWSQPWSVSTRICIC